MGSIQNIIFKYPKRSTPHMNSIEELEEAVRNFDYEFRPKWFAMIFCLWFSYKWIPFHSLQLQIYNIPVKLDWVKSVLTNTLHVQQNRTRDDQIRFSYNLLNEFDSRRGFEGFLNQYKQNTLDYISLAKRVHSARLSTIESSWSPLKWFNHAEQNELDRLKREYEVLFEENKVTDAERTRIVTRGSSHCVPNGHDDRRIDLIERIRSVLK